MATKKWHWFWNLLIVLTLIICGLAFAAHSKNWTKVTPDKFQLLSGFYYKALPFAELDSVEWVDKIPPMQRLNGFSAFDRGKGIYQEFQDSLTDKKVHVFVDNFSHRKIALTYQDSMKLYFNLKDSIATEDMYELLLARIPVASD